MRPVAVDEHIIIFALPSTPEERKRNGGPGVIYNRPTGRLGSVVSLGGMAAMFGGDGDAPARPFVLDRRRGHSYLSE